MIKGRNSSQKNQPHRHSGGNGQNTNRQTGLLFVRIGGGMIAVGIILFVAIFRTVLWEEARYWFISRNADVAIAGLETEAGQSDNATVIEPADPSFSVIIPRIQANAPVVADVDPFVSQEYQLALSQGIAHAHSTAYPGQPGTIFLFAHSAGNFYEANQYNAVFYLLNKLSEGDETIIFYEDEPYRYRVTGQRIVNPDEISYLSDPDQGDASEQLIMMTCWPAGTTLQRLLIFAERVPVDQE